MKKKFSCLLVSACCLAFMGGMFSNFALGASSNHSAITFESIKNSRADCPEVFKSAHDCVEAGHSCSISQNGKCLGVDDLIDMP